MINPIEWCSDSVKFLDQSKLPLEEVYIQTCQIEVIIDAICSLKIRGAPLLGITAAYAMALEANQWEETDFEKFVNHLNQTIEKIRSTRPTAVNLSWALNRVKFIIDRCSSVKEIREKLVEESKKIHDEDREMCRRIGINGNEIIPENASILTHCNTGALATGGSGTAQSIITTSYEKGKKLKVYVDETRPLLQGARLTVWELNKHGVDVTLITDNMAAFLMQQGKIDLVLVGADRITRNGDVVNKIGTYNIAVLSNFHKIPFYVAAPVSTIDNTIKTGQDVVIEERSPDEVRNFQGCPATLEKIKVYNPAFDITPNFLVSAIITDRGINYPPYDFSILI